MNFKRLWEKNLKLATKTNERLSYRAKMSRVSRLADIIEHNSKQCSLV